MVMEFFAEKAKLFITSACVLRHTIKNSNGHNAHLPQESTEWKSEDPSRDWTPGRASQAAARGANLWRVLRRLWSQKQAWKWEEDTMRKTKTVIAVVSSRPLSHRTLLAMRLECDGSTHGPRTLNVIHRADLHRAELRYEHITTVGNMLSILDASSGLCIIEL